MKLLFSLIFIFTNLLSAQETGQRSLSGNIAVDAAMFAAPRAITQTVSFPITDPEKRSPLLAALFSAVLPGSGQFYNGDYIRAGIFAGLEIAGIVAIINYDKKGDDQTDVFENFANVHWSVVRYAEWLNRHKGARIQIDPNTSLQPWQRIVSWDSLNAAEVSFSHKLEKFGRQQYYEMIGKYPQFSSGWESYEGYTGFDPANPNYNEVPPILQYYSAMRGKANDYYNISSKVAIGLYVNHLLSALDAVWSAVSYNNSLKMQVRYEQQYHNGVTEFIPKVKMSWRF